MKECQFHSRVSVTDFCCNIEIGSSVSSDKVVGRLTDTRIKYVVILYNIIVLTNGKFFEHRCILFHDDRKRSKLLSKPSMNTLYLLQNKCTNDT